MDEIKEAFWKIAIIVFVLGGGLTFLATCAEYIAKAALWLVYVDNQATGLPEVAEIIIKAIVESLVVGLCSLLSISKKNPIVTAVSILLGFISCMIIYMICKYIIWILIILAVIFAALIIISIYNCKKGSKEVN